MGLFSSGRSQESTRDKRLDETQRNQAAAADPPSSAWVCANAGTGKTHVLTMRVLRLLLAGTPPERILALTYTKAAAAEMAEARVRAAGGMGDGRRRGPEGEARRPARRRRPQPRCSGRASCSPSPSRRRAGSRCRPSTPSASACCSAFRWRPACRRVSPSSTTTSGAQLLKEAADEVLAEATARADTPLAGALETAVAYATDSNFDQVLDEALRERDWLAAAVRLDDDGGPTSPGRGDLPQGARHSGRRTPRGGRGEAWRRCCRMRSCGGCTASWRRARPTTSRRPSVSPRRCARAGPAGASRRCSACSSRPAARPRKSLMTQGLAAPHPDALALAGSRAGRVPTLHEQRCKLSLLDATMALVRLGNAVMQRYGDAKARRAALDFDDLVARTASLLRSSAAVEWVLYKLDGGLDHILVDEAQDTSPVQWQVIRALAEEFFAGHGASEQARTLFAVGDEKQSIYSFQGADPTMFADTGTAFAAHAERAGLPWRRMPLTLSFRTVGAAAGGGRPHLRPAGPHAGGQQLARADPPRRPPRRPRRAWSRSGRPRRTSRPSAPSPGRRSRRRAPTPSPVRLATRIADTIGGWLESGEMLASEARPMRAGDILILVRKRAPFAAAMISALKLRGIPVAGADRLMLTEQIAVQDLIALGDVLTLPEDDLALAAVLKSPLIGLDDDDLMALAPGGKARCGRR